MASANTLRKALIKLFDLEGKENPNLLQTYAKQRDAVKNKVSGNLDIDEFGNVQPQLKGEILTKETLPESQRPVLTPDIKKQKPKTLEEALLHEHSTNAAGMRARNPALKVIQKFLVIEGNLF